MRSHFLAGGVTAGLQGGKFGHGFASAGVIEAFAKTINGIDKGARFSAGRVAAVVVGGTASKVSGGKFSNGAVTGASSRNVCI